MSGMVFTLTGKIFIEVTLHYRKSKYFTVWQKEAKSRLSESHLWHFGMCVCYLIFKTSWCSFPYECLCSWAKSGASFL